MSEIGFLMNYNGNKRLGDSLSTNDLLPTMQEMVNINKVLPDDLGTKVINVKTLKSESSSFCRSLYDIHKVGLLKSKLKLLGLNLFIKKGAEVPDIIDKYNGLAKYVDPFDLPIIFKEGFTEGGSICFQNDFFNEYYPEELIKGIKVFFTGITLNKELNEMSIPFYIHEITHSQLDSNKGTIEEFYNEELLSIFNELLYSYNHDDELFQKNVALRIRYMIQEYMAVNSFLRGTSPRPGYSNDDCYHSMTYIKSTLKAFNLLYLYNINNSQERIINAINEVMNGKTKLEELLSDLNITDESMLNANNIRSLF